MKLLAFDLETAKITPDGDDIQSHRPLGICCWATAWIEDGEIKTRAGCGVDEHGKMARLSWRECNELLDILYSACTDGNWTLLTHNGVGFDLDILAEESGQPSACARLAMRSVDTCFLVHCLKGFPVGLDAVSKGMGLSGKTEGMNGAMAPQMWQEGRYDEVLAYVAQDARLTLEVALEIEERRGLVWIAKSGRPNLLRIPKLLTVQECLKLPEPDTSWMSDPMPRSKFVGWMQPATVE